MQCSHAYSFPPSALTLYTSMRSLPEGGIALSPCYLACQALPSTCVCCSLHYTELLLVCLVAIPFPLPQYPPGIDSTNVDDELSIINQTLPVVADEPGTSPSDALTLCSASTCTEHGGKPGWVKTTVLGRITQAQDQDWYQLTVAKAGSFTIQLTVHGNWHQTYWSGGSEEEVTWRISNLRPEVQFADAGVKVAAAEADMLTW